jgi:hypothetical protein
MSDGEPSRPPAPRPQWLFIVRRDQEALYSHLRQAFAGSPAVQVILDRRQADRRQRALPVGEDRRRGDRRWPMMSPAEHDLWHQVGLRLVFKTTEIEVYESFGEGDPGAEERR